MVTRVPNMDAPIIWSVIYLLRKGSLKCTLRVKIISERNLEVGLANGLEERSKHNLPVSRLTTR